MCFSRGNDFAHVTTSENCFLQFYLNAHTFPLRVCRHFVSQTRSYRGLNPYVNIYIVNKN